MKIDRALFLHLVPVIAAGNACNSSPPSPPPVTARPAATASAPPAASSLEASASAPAPSAPDAAPAEPGPLDAGARVAAAVDAGATLPKYTCAQLKCPLGAPFREAFTVLKRDCKALEQNLRAEPFQRVMACMMSHNDTRDTCDLSLWSANPGDCLEGWHKGTIEASTDTACRRVTGVCKKSGSGALSMSDCQGMLSATAPRGERKMIACMSEYCDQAPRLCHMAFD